MECAIPSAEAAIPHRAGTNVTIAWWRWPIDDSWPWTPARIIPSDRRTPTPDGRRAVPTAWRRGRKLGGCRGWKSEAAKRGEDQCQSDQISEFHDRNSCRKSGMKAQSEQNAIQGLATIIPLFAILIETYLCSRVGTCGPCEDNKMIMTLHRERKINFCFQINDPAALGRAQNASADKAMPRERLCHMGHQYV